MKPLDEARELAIIEGTVEAVIFRNEENGYTVLRLIVGESEPVTVVGCMPGAAPGEGLTVHGSWGRHSSYGEQFAAEAVARRIPVGEKAIFDYLASGAIKGIGMATARRLLDTFGEDVFRVLDEEPERVAKLKGITLRRAGQMAQSLRMQMGMRLLLDFLTAHALPLQLGMPLYRRYGNQALKVLTENPYLLVDEELGVDFAVADALALEIGLDGEDPQRIEAGILFELAHNLNNGHAFLPRDKLLGATGQLISVEGEGLADGLEALVARGEVVREQVAGREACYLASLHFAESYVAFRLAEMSGHELCPPDDLDKLLSRIEREQGITYAPRQRSAVELAAKRQVMLLTGGPGTGKTTSLRGVLALFDALGLETSLTAPTGRAAKRLSETCGMEASTIHRLLETQFDARSGQLVFAHGEDDPLAADAVIVDETSMVDIVLMQALLSALRGDCRLILVGDPDQLPSVGPGNLLSDLLRSGRIPTVRLDEIFRQAAESVIVLSAHRVNRGEPPDLHNNHSDFFFLRRKESQRTAETIVELCSKRLPEKLGIPADQIQVLSPTRKRQTGTFALNQLLQAALNPSAQEKPERRFGPYLFRQGDRVMQVKNNYDLMWKDGMQSGLGVFNGDIGRVTEIDAKEERLTVDFDGRVVDYTPDLLGELEPAYAMTVHKAQGSEYRAVILAVQPGAPLLLTRGVLYTAITRARELFIIVGDEEAVAQMVANNRQTKRYSGLRARLAEME